MTITYVFDVDGTLTAPRQIIEPGFADFFLEFARNNTVYLVSGSDLGKLREQLPDEILIGCQGVFTCSGAERWHKGELIYRKTHEFPAALLYVCDTFVNQSPYRERYGNHIEHRSGMVNISVVGRNASIEQRNHYFEWDKEVGERAKFVERINASRLPYEASAGGEISIDIVPCGWNKSVVMKELLAQDPTVEIFFFGDRTGPGGNDRPLADALWQAGAPHRVNPVRHYSETWNILRGQTHEQPSRAA